MRPLTIAALILALFPALVWGPMQPPQFVIRSPRDYVLMQATRFGVPIPLALAIWEIEASLRTAPPDSSKGARGAFQVMRVASVDMDCHWPRMRAFRVSVPCGMKFLASKIAACRGVLRAAHAYYNGHCPRRGKVGAYAQAVGRLIVKHSGVLSYYWAATLIGASRPQQTHWIRLHHALCKADAGKYLWERGPNSITVLCVPIDKKTTAGNFFLDRKSKTF